ncbi:hypothetical protein ACFL3W_00490, partial [Pseudomonadota bacterium]
QVSESSGNGAGPSDRAPAATVKKDLKAETSSASVSAPATGNNSANVKNESAKPVAAPSNSSVNSSAAKPDL